MARSSLSDVEGSIIDPVQTWNFDMVFEKLPTGLSGSMRDLAIRCQTSSLPGVAFDVVEVALHGVKLRYRGMRTYNGSFTCSFTENIDLSTYKLFKEWHNLMLSWQSNSGSSSSVYKVPADIILYDDAGNEVLNKKIVGVWPSEIADVNLDGSSSEAVKIEMTFTYDYLDEE